MEGQYVIVDLKTMEFMKDLYGEINYYNTKEEALDVCGIYEFEDVWIMKLIYNYLESK
jgi:hypothetical protein